MKSLLIFPRKGILNMIIYEKFLEIFCVKIKYIKIDFYQLYFDKNILLDIFHTFLKNPKYFLQKKFIFKIPFGGNMSKYFIIIEIIIF